MFEQAELRGIPMAPHGPPNAKGTAQIAPDVAILEIQVLCSFYDHFGKTGRPFWPPILATHDRGRMEDGPPEKKYHLESGLNQRDKTKSASSPL